MQHVGTWMRIHGRVSFGLRRAEVIPKRSHALHLEGGTRIAWHDSGHINTFLTEDVRKILQSKAWNSFLNKNLTLGELIFKVLGVTSWSECLTMSVLLMTGSASCGTSCAFRMFGVALYFLAPAPRTRLVRASKSAWLRGRRSIITISIPFSSSFSGILSGLVGLLSLLLLLLKLKVLIRIHL